MSPFPLARVDTNAPACPPSCCLKVVLRDGRHLVGVMRSYDQFSNIVLEDTHERHFVGGEWTFVSILQVCCKHCVTQECGVVCVWLSTASMIAPKAGLPISAPLLFHSHVLLRARMLWALPVLRRIQLLPATASYISGIRTVCCFVFYTSSICR